MASQIKQKKMMMMMLQGPTAFSSQFTNHIIIPTQNSKTLKKSNTNPTTSSSSLSLGENNYV